MLVKLFYALLFIGASLHFTAQGDSYCTAMCEKICGGFYTNKGDANSFEMQNCIRTCITDKCPPNR